jgi:hypothetical protein
VYGEGFDKIKVKAEKKSAQRGVKSAETEKAK